jgi:DNA-binding LacI/PurR family transcriptional regulator
LDYIPDPVARTLATKRIGSIGLLLPQPIQETFQNPHMFEVLQGMGSVCHSEGLSLTILPPVKGLLSHTVRTAVVDGIVTIGIGAGADILELIRKRHLPFVTIDGTPDCGILNVGIDDERAGYELMDHVLGLGHRRIALFSLRDAQTSLEGTGDARACRSRVVELRMGGFHRALGERGIPEAGVELQVHPCDSSLEAAEDLARGVLSEARRPSAVVCFSDVAALGVYSAAKVLGLSIPRDLSVAGFDGISFAALAAPPLTTIRQSGFDKGRLAAVLVLDSLHGRPCADVLLGTKLAVGGSTAHPNGLSSTVLIADMCR